MTVYYSAVGEKNWTARWKNKNHPLRYYDGKFKFFDDKGQKYLDIRKLSLTVSSVVSSGTGNVQIVIFKSKLLIICHYDGKNNYYVYFPVIQTCCKTRIVFQIWGF